MYLYIPNVAVGAIIGTKGSYIKNIIKLSGASVKITPLSPEESKTAIERQVVIVGTPDSQWKAQYYIYEKIRQERFATDDNVKLRAEIQVPAHIVGRIIGKSGKNVRELQRSTGATIKLPEDSQQSQPTGSNEAADGTTVSSNENEQGGVEDSEQKDDVKNELAETPAVDQSVDDKEKENNKQVSPDMSPNASNANMIASQNGASNSSFVTGN